MSDRARLSCLFALFFGLSLLIWPSIVDASFTVNDNNLIFTPRDSIYRLRNPAKKWQLSQANPLRTISSVSYNGWSYFVVDTLKGQEVWRTQEGIRFFPYNSFAKKWQIKIIGPYLLAVKEKDGLFDLWQLTESELISWNFGFASLDINNFYFQNESLYYLEIDSQLARWWKVSPSNTQLQIAISCPEGKIVPSAVVRVICNNRELISFKDNFVLKLWEGEYDMIKTSADLIVLFQTPAKKLIVIDEEQVRTFQLTASAQDIFIFNKRVLLKSDQIYELDWDNNQLSALTAADNRIISADNEKETLFISGSESAISSAPLTKTQISYDGDFNHTYKSDLGWLLYQVNNERTQGGRAQFAANGQTTFTKVNPWASTTSPIQAIGSYKQLYFVYVITNSGGGNVNLYQSTDMIKWNRVTLPTSPTYFSDLSLTRSLPAGTLVMAEVVVMVKPSVVANDVIYLFDSTGGIQVFLSSSKGVLPDSSNYRAQVTGEISSSQTKRIILDSLDDLVIGGPQSLPIEKMILSHAQNSLAKLAQVEGRIISITHPSLILNSNEGASLKIRFNLAKSKLNELYAKDQHITGRVLIDWSSASQAIEAWSLDEQFSLINPETDKTLITNNLISNNAPSKILGTAGNTKTRNSLSALAVNRPLSNSDALALVNSTQPNTVLAQKKGVLAAGAQSEKAQHQLPPLVLPLITLIAAMLAMRGWRLQRLFNLSSK